ncbi:hypothetical protein [Dyadobacter psychrotolerans]|uniref:Uncharacterized protein n=1 Tax=Dyadobacter psychrotolerans TaxID=2541721 RepID=A0A4R5DU69_9BACT|nr:hypothetical protein [Dyadobacter psychrotolerans]TDE15671.1 hypothetical protein E0F88_14330 [Dyadobacter psychrotolerans]
MRNFLLPWYKVMVPLACFCGIIPVTNTACLALQADPSTDSLPVHVNGNQQVFRPLKLNLLHGQQTRDRLVQSVGYLDGERLESAPVTLLSNAFAGQLAVQNKLFIN